jgi:hypothetical protein
MSPERQKMVHQVWASVRHRLIDQLTQGPSNVVRVPVRRGSAFQVQGEPADEELQFEMLFGRMLGQRGLQIVCEDLILEQSFVTDSWGGRAKRRVAEALGETP